MLVRINENISRYMRYAMLILFCAFLQFLNPAQVFALSQYQTALAAEFSATDLSGGSLQVFNFVNDDGANPLTTYSLVDPLGAPGSLAVTSAAMAPIASNVISTALMNSGVAKGIAGEPSTMSYSQGTTDGGFMLLNTDTSAVYALFQMNWSWFFNLSTDSPVYDSTLGLASINLYQDGIFLSNLFDTLLIAPPSLSWTDSASWSTIVSVEPGAIHSYSVIFTLNGIGQSWEPAISAVPEPTAVLLMLLGVVGLACVKFACLR